MSLILLKHYRLRGNPPFYIHIALYNIGSWAYVMSQLWFQCHYRVIFLLFLLFFQLANPAEESHMTEIPGRFALVPQVFEMVCPLVTHHNGQLNPCVRQLFDQVFLIVQSQGQPETQ